MGAGNLRYAEYFKVPLTSIDQSAEQMGVTAAKLALELSVNKQQVARTVLMEPQLVVRESSVGKR